MDTPKTTTRTATPGSLEYAREMLAHLTTRAIVDKALEEPEPQRPARTLHPLGAADFLYAVDSYQAGGAVGVVRRVLAWGHEPGCGTVFGLDVVVRPARFPTMRAHILPSTRVLELMRVMPLDHRIICLNPER